MEPKKINADDRNYEALKTWQDNYLKGNDTCKASFPFPEESTVAVQVEDVGPWVHGVIVEVNSTDHNGWSYIVRVTKLGMLITWNAGPW